MRSPNYLVLIRDGRLALAVGAALEERLRHDGHKAIALVPAVRGPDFAGSAAGRLLAPRRPSQNPADHGPHVVALDEEGLLASIASLGLPAYVGTRDLDQPRIARWPDAPGAILLPVATARDLIDAIASHTPWSRHAAELPPARQPARSRKAAVTVASVAGPLLLASLPSFGIAVGGTHAPALTAATALGATAATLTADAQPDSVVPPIPIVTPEAAPVPIPPTTTGTHGTWNNLLSQASSYLTQATAQTSANATAPGVPPAPVPIPPTDMGTPGTWNNLLSQASSYLAQATAPAFASATVTGAGASASQSGTTAVVSWARSVVAQLTQAKHCATFPPHTKMPHGPAATASSTAWSGNTTAGSHPWHWPHHNVATAPAQTPWGQWSKTSGTPVSTAPSSSGDTTNVTSTSSAWSGNTNAGFQAWNSPTASSGVQFGQARANGSDSPQLAKSSWPALTTPDNA